MREVPLYRKNKTRVFHEVDVWTLAFVPISVPNGNPGQLQVSGVRYFVLDGCDYRGTSLIRSSPSP